MCDRYLFQWIAFLVAQIWNPEIVHVIFLFCYCAWVWTQDMVGKPSPSESSSYLAYVFPITIYGNSAPLFLLLPLEFKFLLSPLGLGRHLLSGCPAVTLIFSLFSANDYSYEVYTWPPHLFPSTDKDITGLLRKKNKSLTNPLNTFYNLIHFFLLFIWNFYTFCFSCFCCLRFLPF